MPIFWKNGILTVAREMVSPRSDVPMMTKTKFGKRTSEKKPKKKMEETIEFIIEDVKFPESHDTAIHRLKYTE
jgi:hypothetical protein